MSSINKRKKQFRYFREHKFLIRDFATLTLDGQRNRFKCLLNLALPMRAMRLFSTILSILAVSLRILAVVLKSPWRSFRQFPAMHIPCDRILKDHYYAFQPVSQMMK